MRIRRARLRAIVLVTGTLLAATAPMFAQHEVTAEDVREGEQAATKGTSSR